MERVFVLSNTLQGQRCTDWSTANRTIHYSIIVGKKIKTSQPTPTPGNRPFLGQIDHYSNCFKCLTRDILLPDGYTCLIQQTKITQ